MVRQAYCSSDSRYDARMSKGSIGLGEELNAYLVAVGVREPEVLRRLREETEVMPQAGMQIAIEQGALLALLVRVIGARRVLEVGTFTGYSSTAMALALPPDGRIVCCDISAEFTDVARRYWSEAGISDRVELRLAPALETLEALLAADGTGSFDLAFIDADKTNLLWSGRVIDPGDTDEDTQAIRDLNADLATDERVDIAMVPIADGVTLLRVR